MFTWNGIALDDDVEMGKSVLSIIMDICVEPDMFGIWHPNVLFLHDFADSETLPKQSLTMHFLDWAGQTLTSMVMVKNCS